ncbi:allophanate hydrolase [Psychromonas sp. B3M02]|uniref:5-oxoprolinase subunit C family protein n=1 Tax=Psychromonas sp. B3M02 TaxID=2267226 RepID=UPI000DEB5F3A|nr:biotin-dependent carboxyltransferase family protein [Psychromonas sp. B3M02]RBW46985.1 allophanate hydrolase [Psychromonas sp. B3M02]
MTLHIKQAGVLSLLQDLGRYGHQDVGVTPGGPMDSHAFHWANKLLDNPANSAQIEITMGPFQAHFQAETSFSVCGADVELKLNGISLSPWRSWQAQKGDLLEIGYPSKGLRSYLAVAGGFQVSETLGSASSVVRDQLGGLDQQGHKLSDGDVIPYQSVKRHYTRTVTTQFIPDFNKMIRLGVLPTYQFHEFSHAARRTLFNELYTVTPEMDRMGYRLKGKAIEVKQQNFISEGIVLGAIQIPANGQPIVLMRDRQTIGGYPKIGCICQRDLNLLSQATPGTKIQFFEQDLYQAEAELQQTQQYFFEGE